MTPTPAAILENATKRFGDLTAVNNVSLEIQSGEIFGIIGPNGAGKTTIVNMICGMFAPDSGRVQTLGLDPIRQERRLREILGVQFQEAKLPGMLKVEEALRLYSSFYESPRDWRVLAEEWGIGSKLDSRFEKLSGGQKQRLSIARALLIDPRILILDDATASVDSETEHEIQLAMRELMKGRTSIVIASRLSTVRDADQVLVFEDGEITQRGNHESLITEDGFYADVQSVFDLLNRPDQTDDTVDQPQPKPIVYGVAGALSPMVRRIVAANPGMMTGPGTNTYLVGIDEVAVIDPGPADDAHLEAIHGCGGDRIRWITMTDTDPAYSAGAQRLKELTGAEIIAAVGIDFVF